MKMRNLLIPLILAAAFARADDGPPMAPMYLTNRTPPTLVGVLNALTNAGPGNGSGLTNINAVNLTNVLSLGVGLGLQQIAHLGTSDVESSGNNQSTADVANAMALWWTNGIVATNLHFKAGGKLYATNVVVEIFQTPYFSNNCVLPYTNYPVAPLWSNVVTLPYWNGQGMVDVQLPAVSLSAGVYTWLVIGATNPTLAGTFEFYYWHADAGNTGRLPYSQYQSGTGWQFHTNSAWSTDAEVGFRIDGYVTSTGNAQTANYAQVAGTLTNAMTIGLLNTNNYPDQSRAFVFVGDSRAGDNPAWPVMWMTNYPTFARAAIFNRAVGGTTWWEWMTNYPITGHVIMTNLNAAQQTNLDAWVSAYCGINDINDGSNATQIINNMSNVWTQITNDGAGLIAWTVAPSATSNSTKIATLASVNQWIRSNYTSWGYAGKRVMLMQPDVWIPNAYDTNWYRDGTHQTTNGLLEMCRQFDATFRGNALFSVDAVTNTWLLASSPAGYPLSIGVGGGVTNIAMTISQSNTVAFSNSVSAAGFTGSGAGLTNVGIPKEAATQGITANPSVFAALTLAGNSTGYSATASQWGKTKTFSALYVNLFSSGAGTNWGIYLATNSTQTTTGTSTGWGVTLSGGVLLGTNLSPYVVPAGTFGAWVITNNIVGGGSFRGTITWLEN